MKQTHHPLEIREARPDAACSLAPLLAELGFPAAASTVALRLESLLAADEVVLVAARNGALLGLVTIRVTQCAPRLRKSNSKEEHHERVCKEHRAHCREE